MTIVEFNHNHNFDQQIQTDISQIKNLLHTLNEKNNSNGTTNDFHTLLKNLYRDLTYLTNINDKSVLMRKIENFASSINCDISLDKLYENLRPLSIYQDKENSGMVTHVTVSDDGTRFHAIKRSDKIQIYNDRGNSNSLSDANILDIMWVNGQLFVLVLHKTNVVQLFIYEDYMSNTNTKTIIESDDLFDKTSGKFKGNNIIIHTATNEGDKNLLSVYNLQDVSNKINEVVIYKKVQFYICKNNDIYSIIEDNDGLHVYRNNKPIGKPINLSSGGDVSVIADMEPHDDFLYLLCVSSDDGIEYSPVIIKYDLTVIHSDEIVYYKVYSLNLPEKNAKIDLVGSIEHVSEGIMFYGGNNNTNTLFSGFIGDVDKQLIFSTYQCDTAFSLYDVFASNTKIIFAGAHDSSSNTYPEILSHEIDKIHEEISESITNDINTNSFIEISVDGSTVKIDTIKDGDTVSLANENAIITTNGKKISVPITTNGNNAIITTNGKTIEIPITTNGNNAIITTNGNNAIITTNGKTIEIPITTNGRIV